MPTAPKNWSPWTYRIIRIVIGTLFAGSGVVKLMDPQGFAVNIESYGLVPDATILPIAVFLSVAELLAGLGLMFDIQFTLVCITALLLFFILILSFGIWLGLDIDCGCFGPGDPEADAYRSLWPALYRDLVMLAGIVYLFDHRRRHSISPRKISTLYPYRIKRR